MAYYLNKNLWTQYYSRSLFRQPAHPTVNSHMDTVYNLNLRLEQVNLTSVIG